jgi:hypothetical protein
MIVEASGETHIIPLSPPMKSFREARERLVQMDSDTIAGLKRSKITIKEYRAPRGIHAAIFGACLFAYALLARPNNYLPGSLLHSYLPAFAEFVDRVRDWVLWPMIALHLGESYVMRGRLEKHSVALFSRVWWLWVISSFIEGAGSFQRYVQTFVSFVVINFVNCSQDHCYR